MNPKHVTKPRCLIGGSLLAAALALTLQLPLLLMVVVGGFAAGLPWPYWVAKDNRTKWQDFNASELADAFFGGTFYSFLGGFPFVVAGVIFLIIRDQFR